MLMGEYQHSVDAKGRTSLPADFRGTLGESFVITKGLDKCLYIYNENEWQRLTDKIAALPMTKKDVRDFSRFFIASARRAECDKQGRFLLPGNLRIYAGLEKDAVLVGVVNRVEVWARDEWERYNAAVTPVAAQIAENITDLGI